MLPQPLVLVSVYMPCNGGRCNSTTEFLDCLDQLHALYTRYSATHSILIGGNMNENIMVASDTQRKRAFRKILQDNSLEYSTLGKTFIDTAGVETSAIDYFVFDTKLSAQVNKLMKLDNCAALLLDHYPLICKLNIAVETKSFAQRQLPMSKIKWNKIDVQEYACKLTDKLDSMCCSENLNSVDEIDTVTNKLNKAVLKTVEQFVPKRPKKRVAPKLKVTSVKMKAASSSNKKLFRQW